jgi:hypothetical protein
VIKTVPDSQNITNVRKRRSSESRDMIRQRHSRIKDDTKNTSSTSITSERKGLAILESIYIGYRPMGRNSVFEGYSERR